jgi:hypothetical protein
MRIAPFPAVVVATAVLTALTASVVRAAPPTEHYHFTFTCTATPASPDGVDCGVGPDGQPITHIDPNLCDIPGTLVDSQSGNVQLFADGTQKAEQSETYVFTSAPTGKSIESRSNAQLTQNTVPIVSADGKTISFIFAFKGVEQHLKLPDGTTLALDAGPNTITVTIDVATGAASFSVSERGRHANLYSQLCNVVVRALS